MLGTTRHPEWLGLVDSGLSASEQEAETADIRTGLLHQLSHWPRRLCSVDLEFCAGCRLAAEE